MDFKLLSLTLLKLLGGKENIKELLYSPTEIRAELYDTSLADMQGLRNVRKIRAVAEGADYLRIILGADTPKIYQELYASVNPPAKDKKRLLSLFFKQSAEYATLFLPLSASLLIYFIIIYYTKSDYLSITALASALAVFIVSTALLWLCHKPVAYSYPLTNCTRVLSPVSGITIPLAQVADPAISDGVLGQGVAIMPDSNLIVSPVSGVVTDVSPTGHALSVTADNRTEIFIHIGVDTIALGKEFFTVYVTRGDRVRAGDVLVKFRLAEITQAGFSPATSVIVANSASYKEIRVISQTVREQSPLLEIK